MRSIVLFVFLVFTATVLSAAALESRYVVHLAAAASEVGDAALAAELARSYGGTLEWSSFDVQAHTFVLALSAENARQLRADPRVRQLGPAAPAVLVSEGAAQRRATTLGSGVWDSGAYHYDTLGNTTSIGADAYAYDTAQRLVSGTADVQRSGIASEQHYTYDSFGNRTSAARTAGSKACVNGTDCEFPVTIDAITNHITSDGAVYDDAGNITVHGAAHYTYDSLNMLVHVTELGNDTQFVYTPGDERIAADRAGAWTWSVRDLGAKVVREFTSVDPAAGASAAPGSQSRAWKRDRIWRDGGSLVATVQAAQTGISTTIAHFHVDHLGSPRVVTDGGGAMLGFHAYYPFGAELDLGTHEYPDEVMKFTGHERDITADIYVLDNMHGRYYSPMAGRFLSVDPGRSGSLSAPQTLGRYSYARNNPIARIDPNGLMDIRTADDKSMMESHAVLITIAQLKASTASGFEYGALVGKNADGSYMASHLYTTHNPTNVGSAGEVTRTADNRVVITGTDVTPTAAWHTHLPKGRYPDPSNNTKDLLITNNTEPSSAATTSTNQPGDIEFVTGTKVPGFILVPSESTLLKVNADGTWNPVLTGTQFDQLMADAQAEQNIDLLPMSNRDFSAADLAPAPK